MKQALLIVVIASLAAGTGGAEACGDKFLRVGRGARYQRGYVAIHPACVLLYADPKSSLAAALRELEPALKRAGHKPLIVENPAMVATALKSGHYNLIVADLKDVAEMEGQARATAVKFDVLPVLHEPTSAARAAAEKDYRCVAETPGKKAEVLAKIDDLMELALKGTGEKNRRQP